MVILSCAVYFFAYKNTSRDFNVRLELRAIIAAKANLDTLQATSITYDNIKKQHLQMLPEETEYIINTDTLSTQNSVIIKATNAQFIQNILAEGKASYRNRFLYFSGIKYTANSKTYLVIVSAKDTYEETFLLNLKRILFIACIVGLVIIFFAALIFAKHTLAPIRNITKQVNKISATSLHMRLFTKPGKDEITMLSDTFNDMLNRLETAFETQNNFVSNASHELNTPLTSIIGEADLALAKERATEDYKRALVIIMQQGERLQAITKSLLQLAQIGFTDKFTIETVSIDDLIHNTIANGRNVYQDCEINIDQSLYPSTKKIHIKGNNQLLELALTNVVLNACKYSRPKPVNIGIALSEKHIIFMVKDNGIGIPENEIRHIFDPFFRASNVKGTIGYGIGLPLVKNIITLHKGSIEIHSKQNAGTQVIIKLPVSN